MLAEALVLHENGGEPVDDDALRAFGLEPDADGDEELPECMR
jgi:hypothetical protein